MSTLAESWKRTEAHLRRAHESAGHPALADFHDYLDHNEPELAADVLADFGDERENLAQEFWEELKYAYEKHGVGLQGQALSLSDLRGGTDSSKLASR